MAHIAQSAKCQELQSRAVGGRRCEREIGKSKQREIHVKSVEKVRENKATSHRQFRVHLEPSDHPWTLVTECRLSQRWSLNGVQVPSQDERGKENGVRFRMWREDMQCRADVDKAGKERERNTTADLKTRAETEKRTFGGINHASGAVSGREQGANGAGRIGRAGWCWRRAQNSAGLQNFRTENQYSSAITRDFNLIL
ncbi:hypothetical protein M427DRAFT_487164 [Gonapodya prolifera JEL478]|uniref:Uncharacterized protein n=1 Tax=Gonapodya prolifera (strain JEL478) TaxID=1344416 RepID=A0A139A0D6_GONPJ|nr:hypothetical protein M427DRAFT_487164 [Gonapodya prolifera JEL478]|eukprot:KXS10246.1 hypothetical protein M427DRAFT_487164 [Gonapodya prolifera JEL478]